jgi:hypothetical protein
MSTILAQPVPFLYRWLRAIVESLLPRSLRNEYMASFDRYRDRSMFYQIEHGVRLVAT